MRIKLGHIEKLSKLLNESSLVDDQFTSKAIEIITGLDSSDIDIEHSIDQFLKDYSLDKDNNSQNRHMIFKNKIESIVNQMGNMPLMNQMKAIIKELDDDINHENLYKTHELLLCESMPLMKFNDLQKLLNDPQQKESIIKSIFQDLQTEATNFKLPTDLKERILDICTFAINYGNFNKIFYILMIPNIVILIETLMNQCYTSTHPNSTNSQVLTFKDKYRAVETLLNNRITTGNSNQYIQKYLKLILSDKLYEKSSFQQIPSSTINRHKILHGEKLDYDNQDVLLKMLTVFDNLLKQLFL